jgi:hypothetical protein
MGADLYRGGSSFFFRPRREFQVRVAKKLDGVPTMHPWVRLGCEFGYEVRQANEPWVAGRKIQLVRGQKYTFRLYNVSRDFPFYISYSEIGSGNGAQEYLQGVQGSPAIGNEVLTFTVPFDCPSLLYYQCARQKSMGGPIYIVDDDQQLTEVIVEDKDSVVSEQAAIVEPPSELPPAGPSQTAPVIPGEAPSTRLPEAAQHNLTYIAPPGYANAIEFHLPAKDPEANQERPRERPVMSPTYIAPPSYDLAMTTMRPVPQRAQPPLDLDERKKSD